MSAPKAIETAIEKKPSQALEQAPSYIDQGRHGLEEATGRQDFTIPRIALAQSLTPQRKKTNASYIPGLEEGQLFNTLTGKIYGDRFTGVPLFFFKQQYLFEDIEKGGGILCVSANGVNGGQLHPSGCETCPKNQFVDGKAPDCAKLMNYLFLLSGNELAVLSLKSTQIGKAKNFNAMIRLSGRPMFSRFVEVLSIGEKKHNQDYFGISLTQKEWVPEELYRAAKSYFDELHGKGIQVDTTGITDESDEFATGGASF